MTCDIIEQFDKVLHKMRSSQEIKKTFFGIGVSQLLKAYKLLVNHHA